MATNNILPWASGTDANVLTDADYASALAENGTYQNGVQTGQASSKQANKTWRQAVAPASGVAQFIVDNLGVDVSDSDAQSVFSARLANASIKLGQISPHNSAYATTVGGYKLNDIVSDASTPGVYWRSTVSNNLTVPGSSGSSWVSLLGDYATQEWVEDRGYATESYVQSGIIAGLGLAKYQSDPGYTTLPGGAILQYGTSASGSEGGGSVTFPIRFPTACISVNVSENSAGTTWPGTGSGGEPTVHGLSQAPATNGFTTYSMRWTGSSWVGQTGLGFSWIAVGY